MNLNKKQYLFGLLIVFVVIAIVIICCKGKDNSTIICTYEGSSNSVIKEEIEVKLDSNGKVEKINGLILFNDENKAKENFESTKNLYGDNAKLDGEKIIINNIEEANTYKNTVGKTREEFIEYMKSNAEDSTKIKCK